MVIPLVLLVLALQNPPTPEPPAEKQQKGAKKPDIVVLDPAAPKLESEEGVPPTEYAFNPHQAKKELEVGEFYMRKNNYSAAALRFEQALKWYPRFPEALLRLAEAREKTGELKKAVEAYQQYLEVTPNGKKARDARKAIARLERDLKK